VVLVAAQLSVLGYISRRVQILEIVILSAPDIISLPVRLPCERTGCGRLVVLVAVQVSGVHPVAVSDIVGSVYLALAAVSDLRRLFSAWLRRIPPASLATMKFFVLRIEIVY